MSLLLKKPALRAYLDENFKPTFDEYLNEGGIPSTELRKLLETSDLPKSKLNKLIDAADANGDNRITYDEFLNQVGLEGEATVQHLRIQKRMLNRAVYAIAPDQARNNQRIFLRQKGLDYADNYNWGEAFVDNYVEAYDCRPPPLFIPIITIAEVYFDPNVLTWVPFLGAVPRLFFHQYLNWIGVFIYYAVLLGQDADPWNDVTASTGVPITSPLIYSPTKRHEFWRFISYMFIHCGYLHLAFNCLWQLILGTLLELVHKFWRVGLVYCLGVIAGSLAHSVSDPYIALVGASGGCYALIGAHLASVIMNWKAMQDRWLKNPINFISSGVFRLFLICLLAGGDTGLAIYGRLRNPHQTVRVGFSAHLGGFVAGLLMGIPILRNLEVERWEKVCFWICIVIYCLFIVGAILFNLFCERINKCPASVW